MKKCLYCKIEVGGDLKKCPICQSKLIGEDEEAYFPKQLAQQRRSLFYKFQLFTVWVLAIVGLGVDFLFHVRITSYPDIHWSLILMMWLFAFEFGIMRQFKPGTGSARKVTSMVFLTLIMFAVTAYFFDFFWLALDWVIPIVIIASTIANFVLALIDKKGNTMAYLLSNLLVGVIPYIILYIRHKSTPVAWIICLIASVIFFIGAIIFKGTTVAKELQRRFYV